MILETIFLWTGGILLISLILLGLFLLWSWLFDRLFYNFRISIKALLWHIASCMFEKENKKYDMQVGREWYVRYKNKRYLWKCIEVEDIKKK